MLAHRAGRVAALFTFAGPALAPSRSPRARSRLVKGWWVASSHLASPWLTGCPALHLAARKMRLTDFCNRRSTRALRLLPDSRLRSPPAATSCEDATFWTAPIRRGPPSRAYALLDRRPTNHQVKLRLTANLQLQRHRNPSVDLRSRSSRRSPDSTTAPFRSGPRSKALWRHGSRLQPLRPRAERAALPLTPSVATTSLSSVFRPIPRWQPPGFASATVSSKTAASPQPGRLPPTSALSPATSSTPSCSLRRAPAVSSRGFRLSPHLDVRLRVRRDEARDHREPATVPAALPPRAGFERRLHLPRHLGIAPSAAQRARPNPHPARRRDERAGPDASRRPLQSEQLTSTTTNPPTPGRPGEERRRKRLRSPIDAAPPARAGLGGNLRTRLRPRPPHRLPIQVAPMASTSARALRPE